MEGSEKYSLVLSASETVAEIDRILDARNQALRDEARELFGASTPEGALEALLENNRVLVTRGSDGHRYLIFDYKGLWTSGN